MLSSLLLALALPTALAAQTPDVSGTWLSDSNSATKWILSRRTGKYTFGRCREIESKSNSPAR